MCIEGSPPREEPARKSVKKPFDRGPRAEATGTIILELDLLLSCPKLG